MNMMDATEEKKVEIQPLPVQEKPAKRGPGRPKDPNKKPKVEVHAMTPARKAALEKGRVIKAEKLKIKKAEKAKEQEEFKLFQAHLAAKANPNQGYHYDPSIDTNQALRQSSIPAQPESGGKPYVQPNAYTLAPNDSAQIDRMNRIETLLTSFLESQSTSNSTVQNPVPTSSAKVAPHHSSLFNANPYLTRRYKK